MLAHKTHTQQTYKHAHRNTPLHYWKQSNRLPKLHSLTTLPCDTVTSHFNNMQPLRHRSRTAEH